MFPRSLSLSLAALCAAVCWAANPTQPSISPNGVVNAASNLAPGFANAGIARGSLFLIYGSYLGPDTLAQAGFPLPSILSDTRVHVTSGSYSVDVPVLYTSASQVAALLPSNAPEGDAALFLTYRTLTSNPASIHIVKSAFGIFTLNKGGTGQAIIQNYVSQTPLPVNTIISAASPGGVAILWGTGLGPIAGGDEAAGTFPGPLPYLQQLYVGGQSANIRFAGRTLCCAGVDQINFDIPAGVQGCYVPVAAVVNGLVSNVGTMAISPNRECDDPLSFRAADLSTLEQKGSLSVGSIGFWDLSSPPSGSFNGSFLQYSAQGLTTVPVPLHSTAGSCYESQAAVTAGTQTPSYANPVYAGGTIRLNGPAGLVEAPNTSPGLYSFSLQTPAPFPGTYTLSSVGGAGAADIGALQGSFSVGAPLQWTNSAAFSGATFTIGTPLVFRWTPGDPNTYVQLAVNATGATLATSIVCNVQSTAGTFTIPDYLARTIVPGPVGISFGSFTVQHAMAGANLDAGIVTAGTNATVQASFYLPPQ
jgi:uncharacterized protein (TIGR03437 family)